MAACNVVASRAELSGALQAVSLLACQRVGAVPVVIAWNAREARAQFLARVVGAVVSCDVCWILCAESAWPQLKQLACSRCAPPSLHSSKRAGRGCR